MLYPIVNLLNAILQIYLVCIVAWTILSVLISFKIVNAYQPLVRRLMTGLDKLCLPVLRPIQRVLPDLGGFDISPIIVILLITFLQDVLIHTILGF
jgi:YggT family protein